MPGPKIYKNFINGEWVESRTGQTFENKNPANKHELIGIFQASALAQKVVARRGIEPLSWRRVEHCGEEDSRCRR